MFEELGAVLCVGVDVGRKAVLGGSGAASRSDGAGRCEDMVIQVEGNREAF